jgi:hypothetical protein
LELAGMIGNSGMQHVARSPELRRSPAASGLLARSPSPRRIDDEDIEYGGSDTFEDWLWEQQGWGEQQKERADAAEGWIIEHARQAASGDDAASLAEEEERLRRQGVAYPPFSSDAGL